MGDPAPERSHHALPGLHGGRSRGGGERSLCPGLDFLHDGGDQAVLGAEVVDEQSCAGTDLRGQRPQRKAGQAMLQEVLERFFDQLVASLAHETDVTCNTRFMQGLQAAGGIDRADSRSEGRHTCSVGDVWASEVLHRRSLPLSPACSKMPRSSLARSSSSAGASTDHSELDSSGAARDDPEPPGRLVGQIDDPAAAERAAIVDPDVDGLPALEVR